MKYVKKVSEKKLIMLKNAFLTIIICFSQDSRVYLNTIFSFALF